MAVSPTLPSSLLVCATLFGGCITAAANGSRGTGASDPFAEIRGQTIGVVSPTPERRPKFKGDHKDIMSVAADVSVQAAIGGGWRKRKDLARLTEIVDPARSLHPSVQSLLARRFGARFVPVPPREYASAEGGRRSEAAPRISLTLTSKGYGLEDLANNPEELGVFFHADIVLANESGSSSEELAVAKCRLESKWSLSVHELEAPGAGVWLQERLNHLANRCLRLFEEDICRRENPHLKVDQCATLPAELNEVDATADSS